MGKSHLTEARHSSGKIPALVEGCDTFKTPRSCRTACLRTRQRRRFGLGLEVQRHAETHARGVKRVMTPVHQEGGACCLDKGGACCLENGGACCLEKGGGGVACGLERRFRVEVVWRVLVLVSGTGEWRQAETVSRQ